MHREFLEQVVEDQVPIDPVRLSDEVTTLAVAPGEVVLRDRCVDELCGQQLE
jgi:hypothetical protein